jgi:hypothetical protein
MQHEKKIKKKKGIIVCAWLWVHSEGSVGHRGLLGSATSGVRFHSAILEIFIIDCFLTTLALDHFRVSAFKKFSMASNIRACGESVSGTDGMEDLQISMDPYFLFCILNLLRLFPPFCFPCFPCFILSPSRVVCSGSNQRIVVFLIGCRTLPWIWIGRWNLI